MYMYVKKWASGWTTSSIHIVCNHLSTPFSLNADLWNFAESFILHIEDRHRHYWSVLGLFIFNFIQLCQFSTSFSVFHEIENWHFQQFSIRYLKHCRMLLHILKICTCLYLKLFSIKFWSYVWYNMWLWVNLIILSISVVSRNHLRLFETEYIMYLCCFRKTQQLEKNTFILEHSCWMPDMEVQHFQMEGNILCYLMFTKYIFPYL